MSIRQLRKRLDRLIASLPQSRDNDPGAAFRIDPVFARKLRDDYLRLDELVRKRDSSASESALTDAEAEELHQLKAGIAERARSIEIPTGYIRLCRDDELLRRYHSKRLSKPAFGGGKLTRVEDDHEAQLLARRLAVENTPAGLAFARIDALLHRKFFSRRDFSAAEEEELSALKAQYPHRPTPPDHPMAKSIEAWRLASRGGT